MNIALWIVAGLLSVVFLISSAKLVIPKEKIPSSSAPARWVEDVSPGALKALGALELMAALGLVLPAALNIAPILVPLAAVGAALLMTGAVTMRVRRGETVKTWGADVLYLAMAVFIAWGRFGPESFTA